MDDIEMTVRLFCPPEVALLTLCSRTGELGRKLFSRHVWHQTLAAVLLSMCRAEDVRYNTQAQRLLRRPEAY